jgi:hypothetical protein
MQNQTRRAFLQGTGLGLGAIALSTLTGSTAAASSDVTIRSATPLEQRSPHFGPRAKRVIYLHLTGSPPNLDIYDYKPELVKRSGQDCPTNSQGGHLFTTGVPNCSPPPTLRAVSRTYSDAFQTCTALLMNVLRPLMYTEQFNHAPAELLVCISHRDLSPIDGVLLTYDWERKSNFPAGRVDQQRRSAERRELVQQRILPRVGRSMSIKRIRSLCVGSCRAWIAIWYTPLTR